MRKWTAPAHIATMTKISDYREIDEILRSKDFRQGSHTESRPLPLSGKRILSTM